MLVAVHAENDVHVETVRKLLTQYGAKDVAMTDGSWASLEDQPTVPYHPQTEISLR